MPFMVNYIFFNAIKVIRVITSDVDCDVFDSILSSSVDQVD